MTEGNEATAGDRKPRSFVDRVGADLGTRFLWGLGMGLVALAATLAGTLPFALLVVCAALVLSWEWGRLVRGQEMDAGTGLHAIAVAAACALAAFGYAGLGPPVLSIGAILLLLLGLNRHGLLSAVGVFYAGLPAVGLIWLRSDPGYGLRAVLFTLAVVIAVDTSAYFAGRLIGGPKVAPAISPGKTWAGLGGAVLGGAVVGALFALAFSFSPVRLGLIGGGLAVIAQAGDFAESALKRYYGAKDASALIPGHGGVMDRVDGIITVAMAVTIWAAMVDVNAPGRALLLG
ncbi:MAG: phosphatidate cytidylyltransferase [Hyphomicrobiaceae bacterium]